VVVLPDVSTDEDEDDEDEDDEEEEEEDDDDDDDEAGEGLPWDEEEDDDDDDEGGGRPNPFDDGGGEDSDEDEDEDEGPQRRPSHSPPRITPWRRRNASAEGSRAFLEERSSSLRASRSASAPEEPPARSGLSPQRARSVDASVVSYAFARLGL